MVLPAHRRNGVATLMGERLLARLDTDLVVAAVDLERPDGREDGDGGGRPANAAQATVRAWGWSKLGLLAPHSPSAVREVWIRRPLR